MVRASSFFTWWYKHWGTSTFTFDVICARTPTLAEASLNMSMGDNYTAVGITRLKTKNLPVGEESVQDFGPYYWDWPGKWYNQTMTEVTFALTTGRSSQCTGHFQITFFEP